MVYIRDPNQVIGEAGVAGERYGGSVGACLRLPFVPQSGLAGANDGLRPVIDSEFGEDGRDVVTHGLGLR